MLIKNFALIILFLLQMISIDVIAQSSNIRNDTFWNTKDGRPIYSQGGGIFKFPDPVTGERNITGMAFTIKKPKPIVTIHR